MGFIDKQAGIEAAELWIDLLECAEPPTQNRAFGEHRHGVLINMQSNIAGEFGTVVTVKRGETGRDVVSADPSYRSQ